MRWNRVHGGLLLIIPLKQMVWGLVMLTLWSHGYAKSFGVVGEVFPVAELSFLTLIETRLADLSARGELDALNQRWLKTVAAHSNRPTPLTLARANRRKVHVYKPEVVLAQDITDNKGRVLYRAGTHVNALAKLPSYTPCWLFFNGDDSAQVSWAQRQSTTCSNPKMILTGGEVNSTEQRLNTVIYFDQQGRITSRLKITSLPARVTRQENTLRIDEMVIKENGDVL